MKVCLWSFCVALVMSCATVDTEAIIQRAMLEGERQQNSVATSSVEPRILGRTTMTTIFAPTPLRGADGIACRAGEALISEAAAGQIQRLTPDGSLSTLPIPAKLEAPTHLAFDEQGTLWVTDTANAALWKRSSDGQWAMVLEQLPDLSGLATHEDGVYFSQCDRYGSVSRLSSSENTAQKIVDGLGCPGTPTLWAGGLMVPMRESGEIWRIDPDTGARKRLMRGLQFPLAVRLLANGEAGIVESGTGRIVGLASPHQESPPRPIKTLRPGINDLAICGNSTLVTNAVWGSVKRLRPFQSRPVTLVPGGLLVPQGATLWGTSLLIADGLSVKRLQGGKLSVVAARNVTPGFSTASGITMGSDQTIYISAPDEGRIYQFPIQRPRVEEFSSGMDWPTSLTRLDTGEIAVAETGSGQLLRITSDGLWWPMTYSLVSPLALTTDRARVLVTEPEGGRIISLRDQEAPASLASELSRPVGIAYGRRGRTYVVEHGRAALTERRSDGRLVRLLDNLPLGESGSTYPREVPVLANPEGDVWLILPGDGRVLQLRP